jgi:DNA helicase IV
MTGDEENEKFYDLSIDYNELLTGNSSLTGEQQYRIMRTKTLINPLHFNYGYAITVWKAQGSEWDKVLLLSEPSWPRDPDLCRKYLYTGVTRASKKLVLVT